MKRPRWGRTAGYNTPMRYRLRTLMILLAIAPPALAYGWGEYCRCRERELREQRTVERERRYDAWREQSGTILIGMPTFDFEAAEQQRHEPER